MSRLTVHWSPVPSEEEGQVRFALWPSPVNPDVCFEKAGFTDFGDSDAQWESDAESLLSRLLEALSVHGVPRVCSKPIERPIGWIRRLFTRPAVYSLREQIELPTQWDELPDCQVTFGDAGISLRTGRGHYLFWITLPESEQAAFPSLVERIAAAHPVVRTELKWEYLG